MAYTRRMLGDEVAAAIRDRTTSYPFTRWTVLATLAEAVTGAARDELLAGTLARAADQDDVIRCFTTIAPLLDPATVRAVALDRLHEAPDHATRGLLIGTLPDPETVLMPLLAEVVEIVDVAARHDALWALVRPLPSARRDRAIAWFDDQVERRHGLELARAYYRSESRRSAAEVAMIIEHERATWGAPFTAWRLGSQALGMPSPQREAMLDRAIDEFEALIPTPVDPGNDEGPFWEIASALDERQVRRALAIVDRMDPSRWCYQLAGSRSQLAIRLALLGHGREAMLQIDHMRTGDPFAASWRAQTLGGLVGARLALDPALDPSALLDQPADQPADGEVLGGLLAVLRDRPPPSIAWVEACVAYAQRVADRSHALEGLATAWLDALPIERWLALGVAPLVLIEAVDDAGGDPTELLALVPRDASTFCELCRYRAYLAPTSCYPAWIAWLRTPGSPLELELAPVLAWLGGPHAVLDVGRAIVRAAMSLP